MSILTKASGAYKTVDDANVSTIFKLYETIITRAKL